MLQFNPPCPARARKPGRFSRLQEHSASCPKVPVFHTATARPPMSPYPCPPPSVPPSPSLTASSNQPRPTLSSPAPPPTASSPSSTSALSSSPSPASPPHSSLPGALPSTAG